jgi:hypothetical protein
MSARELIKQVAALPPQERTLFLQLLDGIKTGAQPNLNSTTLTWPDFAERLRQIYGDKAAPDSQHIIDEGRGNR